MLFAPAVIAAASAHRNRAEPIPSRAVSPDVNGRAMFAFVHPVRREPQQPVVKVRLHSAGDASPLPPQRAGKTATLGAPGLTALLLPQIFPICSVVAPCHRGASPPSVRRRTFTTGC